MMEWIIQATESAIFCLRKFRFHPGNRDPLGFLKRSRRRGSRVPAARTTNAPAALYLGASIRQEGEQLSLQ